MKWLMTYPEDRLAVGAYTRWVEGDGVAWEICRPGDGVRRDPGAYAALLLTGGGDVEPQLYHDQTVHAETHAVDPARDRHELDLIEAFLHAGRPVFGICRGIQVISVAFGGRLIQHLPDHLRSRGIDPGGEVHQRKDSYDSLHPLRWPGPGALAGKLGLVSEVNSAHHQAIHPDFVGRGLKVAAVTPAGVIEAIEGLDREAPIVAVQWHPERLPAGHAASSRLLSYLTSICRERSSP